MAHSGQEGGAGITGTHPITIVLRKWLSGNRRVGRTFEGTEGELYLFRVKGALRVRNFVAPPHGVATWRGQYWNWTRFTGTQKGWKDD